MKRTIQTAHHIDAPQERWKALNEINAVSYTITESGEVTLVISPKSKHIIFIKIHVKRAAGREYYYFHLYMYLFICVTPPGQTKKNTDLEFGTHTPLAYVS